MRIVVTGVLLLYFGLDEMNKVCAMGYGHQRRMRMSKTREELRDEGVELYGPVVPNWFKGDCSVPFGLRSLLKAEQGRAACRIHDFRYYCISLAYEPGSPMRDQWQLFADYELKLNRALSMRPRWLSRVFGALYFRGVRLGGKYAMKTQQELYSRMPPSMKACEQLTVKHVLYEYPEVDESWYDVIKEFWIEVDFAPENRTPL